MTIPIPNRIIRLIFRELIYLKLHESNDFQPIGIAYMNATRGCAFGRELIDHTINQLIKLRFIESNNVVINILESKYRFSQKAKELIESGDYETTFSNIITTRYFIFKGNDEFGLSDIYQRKESNWNLLDFEQTIDSTTKSYFNMAKNLNYQIWKQENLINIASKYKEHMIVPLF